MYDWLEKLEFDLLELPRADIKVFLHMPYEYSVELKKNRTLLDEHEKSPEHLKLAEETYIELSQLYNWDRIECVKDETIRTIEDINDEIFKLIEEL